MKQPGRIALVFLVALGLALVGWAWLGGGREPLHEIAVPVAVPESAK